MWSCPTSSSKHRGRCVLARAVRYTSLGAVAAGLEPADLQPARADWSPGAIEKKSPRRTVATFTRLPLLPSRSSRGSRAPTPRAWGDPILAGVTGWGQTRPDLMARPDPGAPLESCRDPLLPRKRSARVRPRRRRHSGCDRRAASSLDANPLQPDRNETPRQPQDESGSRPLPLASARGVGAGSMPPPSARDRDIASSLRQTPQWHHRG